MRAFRSVVNLLSHHIRTASRGRLLLYGAALFGLSRGLSWAAGVRFDIAPLSHFWQYLDPVLLRTRLAESVLYLHTQPPLFNLFLGGVLQLAPGHEERVFQVLYTAGGFAIYVGLFWLLRLAGVGRPLAALLSTLFIVSPSAILYENWLFYTYPLTLLLVLSALLFHAFLRDGRAWQAATFFGILLLLAGIRSMFQLPYFLAAVAGLAVLRPHRRRIVLAAAILPAVLLLSLYTKNLLLFGKFTTSSWLGMNAWGMINRNMPMAEIEQMVADGELSALAVVDRFSPLEQYPPEYAVVSRYAHIPALSQVRKSTGQVNYNHIAYLGISDQYLRDTLSVLRRYPRYFLIGVGKGWFNYLRSSSDYVLIEYNLKRLPLWNDLYDHLLYGKIRFPWSSVAGVPLRSDPERSRYAYIFLAIGLPFLMLYGFKISLWPGRRPLGEDQRALVAYVWFNIVYVAFIGNLLESGENNRFRFMTDPFYVVLLGLFLQRTRDRWRLRPVKGADRERE